ncbi:M23 family metallopeptidase [Marinococcus halophilus]|uniref:M23 family metallopeptidase n=1 Tax=Marinococcus halophilus TaxID=1371 RepID=UPI00360DAB10
MGTRASGLYPKQLGRYAIYGAALHSPCTGKVVEAGRGQADQTPPQSDPENPNGNYVRLACNNTEATVYLSHMREGSVAASEGDEVQKDQVLGRIGNSGNTTEPHLHIHAEHNGKGIPITFQERFLVRNSLVW